MKISIEISMYPLTQDYIPGIQLFIDSIKAHKNIEVRTNGMSTQLFGEYDDVMSLLNASIKEAMISEPKVVFVAKFLNTDVSTFKNA